MSAMDTFVNTPGVTNTPAGSATVILWDSTAGASGTTLVRRHGWPSLRRVVVSIFTDQAATFFADCITPNSSTWRTFNNGGAGEAVAANVLFQRDVFLFGADHRIRVVTGTVPTVWEVSVRITEDRALGQ